MVRGSPVVTTLKLGDFRPDELVNVLAGLWDLTASERLALAQAKRQVEDVAEAERAVAVGAALHSTRMLTGTRFDPCRWLR